VYHDGPTAHARLYGPLNLDTTPHFEAQLVRSLRQVCRALSLDLGAADYVDSDGIRWLQRLQGDLAERGVDLSLAVREGSHAERTFRLLQLDRIFRIDHYPSEPASAEAAASGK
jgi:anti-anti-sigma regulatory factor